MSTRASDTVMDYAEELKQKAERLVVVDFPLKIVKLNELLSRLKLNDWDASKVRQDTTRCVPRPPRGRRRNKRRATENSLADRLALIRPPAHPTPKLPISCNTPLNHIIVLIKPYLRQLFEDSNLLKMWITFMIPKIEDGNNFGVSIQLTMLTEIQSAEAKAEEFMCEISNYYFWRGKYLSKLVKYPHIEDYRELVGEFDEKQYVELYCMMSEVRNKYCILHDLATKNLEKIKTPRTSNTESLY